MKKTFTITGTDEQIENLINFCISSDNNTGNISEQLENQMNCISWKVAKTRVFDASGVTDPENWNWKYSNGIFYPSSRII